MTPAFFRESWIWWSCGIAAVIYFVTAAVVLWNHTRYARRRRLRDRFERLLPESASTFGCPSVELRSALHETPLRTLRFLLTERSVSMGLQTAAAAAMLSRLGEARVLSDAQSIDDERDSWRRIGALRIMAHTRAPGYLTELDRALKDGGPVVVGAVVNLLGRMPETQAGKLLVDALLAGRCNRSRVAMALEAYPESVLELILPLLSSRNAIIRYWSAMLLRRYGTEPEVGPRLATLASDRDPLVRRAAIESLSFVGGPDAIAAAMSRLQDPVSYVRAHAARTLGVLRAHEATDAVLPLLADQDWWVRYAAKEHLEAMGPDVVEKLVPYLSHTDEFARNGSAEVLQNLGAFEQLLEEEAYAAPDPRRRKTLQLLAKAGGVPMWDSVFARLDAPARDRVRAVLSDLHIQGLSSAPEGS